METDFKVKVGEFEGPLDLLLDLIEKRKLHINTVSLSSVADEFLEHIKKHEEFPMADSAEFILIASTLLLIKSKSLLPNLELTAEEEGNIEDLEARLREYQHYKAVATKLRQMFGQFLFLAEEPKIRTKVFAPTREISLEALEQALKEALNNLPKPVVLPKIKVEKIITLEEMIESLSERIQKSFRMSFSDFAKNTNGKAVDDRAQKINVIVSFLAMLELVKRGAVRASQEAHFGNIEMESENISTPTYN